MKVGSLVSIEAEEVEGEKSAAPLLKCTLEKRLALFLNLKHLIEPTSGGVFTPSCESVSFSACASLLLCNASGAEAASQDGWLLSDGVEELD